MSKSDSIERYKSELLAVFKDYFDDEDYALVARNESFFKVIHESLAVTELKTLIEDTFGIEGQTLNTLLFDFDNLDKLAKYLFDLSQQKPLKEEEASDYIKKDGSRTVSYAQERLYFLNRYQPQNDSSYNIQIPVVVHKRLDITILKKALTQLVDEQKILQASFVSEKGQVRIEYQQHFTFTVREHDFTHLSGTLLTDALHELIDAAMKHTFSLASPPLWTLDFVRIENNAVFLLLNMHHLISDYHSLVLFIQLLLKHYKCIEDGNSPQSLQPPLQYEDFIIHEAKALNEQCLPNNIMFWREYLQNRTSTPISVSSKNDKIVNRQFDISYMLDTLTTMSENHKTTYFNSLVSIFFASLNQLFQYMDITIGLPVANRDNRLFDKTIGFFAIPLPFRTILKVGDRFEDLVKRNQNSLNQILNHILPIEQINQLNMTKRPIFQIMFDYLQLPEIVFDKRYPVEYYQELKLLPLTDQDMFIFVLH